jgi:hemerythrin-like domain-containing protein
MTNAVEEIISEHEKIERELIEFDTIISDVQVNYSNLNKVMRTLSEIWDAHEEKEEKIFEALARRGYKIPVDKILNDHKSLRVHWDAIKEVLKTGKESKVKAVLDLHGPKIVTELRRHMEKEDWLIYGLSWDSMADEAKEEINEIASNFEK